MYNVSVTNNYIYSFTVDGGNQLFAPGGTYKFDNWGSHIINVHGMGSINFLDIGDKKLPEYTNPKIPWTNATWGGIVRYRGLEAYFRYEGQGTIQVEIDFAGSIHLHFHQGGMQISLTDMTVR